MVYLAEQHINYTVYMVQFLSSLTHLSPPLFHLSTSPLYTGEGTHCRVSGVLSSSPSVGKGTPPFIILMVY